MLEQVKAERQGEGLPLYGLEAGYPIGMTLGGNVL
jgi:hypothetical protein